MQTDGGSAPRKTYTVDPGIQPAPIDEDEEYYVNPPPYEVTAGPPPQPAYSVTGNAPAPAAPPPPPTPEAQYIPGGTAPPPPTPESQYVPGGAAPPQKAATADPWATPTPTVGVVQRPPMPVPMTNARMWTAQPAAPATDRIAPPPIFGPRQPIQPRAVPTPNAMGPLYPPMVWAYPRDDWERLLYPNPVPGPSDPELNVYGDEIVQWVADRARAAAGRMPAVPLPRPTTLPGRLRGGD